MKAIRLRCFGRVQGVFFRASTQEKALALGVKGWVRNEADGSVTAHAEGDPAAVDQLIEWTHHGPAGADVSRVEIQEAEVVGYSTFEIKRF